MANYLDNLDVIDANNDTTNVLLQDRQSLALSTEALAKANSNITKLNNMQVYNVKDYGAKGDGTTDDTTAVNDAIAAFNNTGGILYFPYGNYVLSDSLTPLTKRGMIIGDSSVIDATSIISSDILFTLSASHISIEGLQIYGPDGIGIAIRTNTRSTVTNCVISGFDHQVDVYNSTVTKITNNYFVNFTVSIYIDNPSNTDAGDHMIYGNTWDTSTPGSGTAIYVNTSGGLYITSNKFLNCAYAFVEGITTDATSVLIFNNNSVETVNGMIFNSPLTGVRFSKITINNNEFAVSGNCMQILDDSEGIVINGNYFEGVGSNTCIFLGAPNGTKAPAKITISDNVMHYFNNAIFMYSNIDKCNIDNNIYNDITYIINSSGFTELSGDNLFNVKAANILSSAGSAFQILTANNTTFKLVVKMSGAHADYGEYYISVVNGTPTFTPIIAATGNMSVAMGTRDIVISGVNVSAGDTITIDCDALMLLVQKY